MLRRKIKQRRVKGGGAAPAIGLPGKGSAGRGGSCRHCRGGGRTVIRGASADSALIFGPNTSPLPASRHCHLRLCSGWPVPALSLRCPHQRGLRIAPGKYLGHFEERLAFRHPRLLRGKTSGASRPRAAREGGGGARPPRRGRRGQRRVCGDPGPTRELGLSRSRASGGRRAQPHPHRPLPLPQARRGCDPRGLAAAPQEPGRGRVPEHGAHRRGSCGRGEPIRSRLRPLRGNRVAGEGHGGDTAARTVGRRPSGPQGSAGKPVRRFSARRGGLGAPGTRTPGSPRRAEGRGRTRQPVCGSRSRGAPGGPRRASHTRRQEAAEEGRRDEAETDGQTDGRPSPALSFYRGGGGRPEAQRLSPPARPPPPAGARPRRPGRTRASPASESPEPASGAAAKAAGGCAEAGPAGRAAGAGTRAMGQGPAGGGGRPRHSPQATAERRTRAPASPGRGRA